MRIVSDAFFLLYLFFLIMWLNNLLLDKSFMMMYMCLFFLYVLMSLMMCLWLVRWWRIFILFFIFLMFSAFDNWRLEIVLYAYLWLVVFFVIKNVVLNWLCLSFLWNLNKLFIFGVFCLSMFDGCVVFFTGFCFFVCLFVFLYYLCEMC